VALVVLDSLLDAGKTDHHADHEVEEVPHVCLVLGRSTKERILAVHPLRKGLDLRGTDPPGEALEPAGWHRIGGISNDLSGRPVYPVVAALPVGVDR
jgi:hypothetical protein